MRAPVNSNSKHGSVPVPSFLLLHTNLAFMRAPAKLWGRGSKGVRGGQWERENDRVREWAGTWQSRLEHGTILKSFFKFFLFLFKDIFRGLLKVTNRILKRKLAKDF